MWPDSGHNFGGIRDVKNDSMSQWVSCLRWKIPKKELRRFRRLLLVGAASEASARGGAGFSLGALLCVVLRGVGTGISLSGPDANLMSLGAFVFVRDFSFGRTECDSSAESAEL